MGFNEFIRKSACYTFPLPNTLPNIILYMNVGTKKYTCIEYYPRQTKHKQWEWGVSFLSLSNFKCNLEGPAVGVS